jgi:hypothetical protein
MGTFLEQHKNKEAIEQMKCVPHTRSTYAAAKPLSKEMH